MSFETWPVLSDDELQDLAHRFLNTQREFDGAAEFGATDVYGELHNVRYYRPEQFWRLLGYLLDFAEDDGDLESIGCGSLEDAVVWGLPIDVGFLEQFVKEHPNAILALQCVWAWNTPNGKVVEEVLSRRGLGPIP